MIGPILGDLAIAFKRILGVLQRVIDRQRWRLEPVFLVECDPCKANRGRRHTCPDHRACECVDPNCRKAVIIEWVQRIPLEPIATCIVECCREWIAPYPPYLYGGGRCGLCGTRPDFKRHDPDSPVKLHPEQLAYPAAPRERERIVVRSQPATQEPVG